MSTTEGKLRELRSAVAEGQDVLAIHYACENFADAKDRPAAVACIAVASVKENTSVAFSLADERPDDSPDAREIALLRRFYRHLTEHRDAKMLHWNMNSSTYGFDALALRYRYLTGSEPDYQPPDHLRYDLDTMIEDIYGDTYIGHPKLYNLAVLNGLGLRSFLSGSEEARRYTACDYGAIRDSTSIKTRVIASLLLKLVEGRLQTQTSVGSVQFAGERLDAVAIALELGNRFLLVERALKRRHSDRTTLIIEDEYDAQDLFRSLLSVFFDDIRPEVWTPSYAGGSSRVDFLLPEFRLAIELKYSRASMSTRDLADQLIIDRDRYKADHNISHLVCLVFDHAGHVVGPRGIEQDLSAEASTKEIAVTVRIYDR